MLIGLCWSVSKVSVGLLIREAIDKGIEPRTLGDGTIIEADKDALLLWALLIGLAGVLAGVLTGLRRYVAFREARWVEMSLRDRIFGHVQRLHFAYHDEMAAGDLMSRANTDLLQINHFCVMIPLTIANFVTVSLVTIILVSLDPFLALLALGSLPILNVVSKKFSSRLHPFVMGIQQESAELASVVDESVGGVRVIKGFGAESVMRARLRVEADDVYEQAIGASRTRATFLPVLDVLPQIGLIAVLGVGGHRVLNGDLTLGSLIAFNFYVGLLIWPLRMLGMIVASAQRASAAATRVAQVLDTEPVIIDAPDARPLPPGEGAVRFEGVHFSYGDDGEIPVLAGLDLDIAAGSSIALVGATGCGKSTVGRLLPRFYEVDAGRVLLDTIDVRSIRLHDLRSAIGIVFEETFLFSDSIAANIAFAEPGASHEAIERAARLAGAHEFIVELDEGYATEIGERGYSLSGGQRQRIAIARAILADPRVLILDDATSSVDPTKEHEIRDALAEVMAGRTTIVIAHRAATIALADRVVLLDDGVVIADGTHESLLLTEPRYREVLAAAAEPDEPLAVGGDR